MKKLFSVILIVLVLAGTATYFFANDSLRFIYANTASALRTFPSEVGAKDITLTCDYHGQELTVSQRLYQSVNDFYQSEPKKTVYYYKDQNENFVYNYPEDPTLDELTQKILDLGSNYSLNLDQKLDLASCLLQSIPYDNEKATKILGADFASYPVDEVIPRFPYETLYDFTGVCTDKSYLGASIAKRMGYKTSLLVFNQQKHLSLGIGVPDGYASFTNTEYGILELTGQGFLVGDVPELNPVEGLAQNIYERIPEAITENQRVKLSNPDYAIPLTPGVSYQRITEREKLKNEIDETYKQIEIQKEEVERAQNDLYVIEEKLKDAKAEYLSDPSGKNYSTYLRIYAEYKTAYNYTQTVIASYNDKVEQYNLLIEEYQNF